MFPPERQAGAARMTAAVGAPGAAVPARASSPPLGDAAAAPPAWAARTWAEWRTAMVTGLTAFVVFKVLTELVLLWVNFGTSTFDRVRQLPANLINPWFKWDAGWYINLAQQGYARLAVVHAAGGHTYDGTGFPPLYPSLIRLTLKTGLHPLAAALLVSSLALAPALVVVSRLFELELGGARARLALLLFLTAPTAFFLAAPYTEPLQVLFLASALLAARRRRWLAAGIALGLAGVTKPYLLLAIVPVLWFYAADRDWSLRRVDRWLLAILLPAVTPLLAWMAYLQYRFHDPLRFIKALAFWRTTTGAPWLALGHAVKSTLTLQYRHDMLFGISILDLASLTALALIGVYLLVHVNRAYGVLLILVAAAIAAAGGAPPLWLGSADRYVTTWVVAFIALAVLLARHRWLQVPVLLVFVFLQVTVLGMFATGQWAG